MLLEAVPFWKCLPLRSVEYDQLGLTPKVPHGNTGLKMFLELNDLFILLQKMYESSFFKSGWNLFISHSFTHLRSQQSQLVWQRSLLQIQKKFRLAQSTQGVDLLSGFKKNNYFHYASAFLHLHLTFELFFPALTKILLCFFWERDHIFIPRDHKEVGETWQKYFYEIIKCICNIFAALKKEHI